jgi:hypothetical protein
MSSHPHFKMLLRVADVDLVRHLTGDPVDDNRHSAIISILTLAWSSSNKPTKIIILSRRA